MASVLATYPYVVFNASIQSRNSESASCTITTSILLVLFPSWTAFKKKSIV